MKPFDACGNFITSTPECSNGIRRAAVRGAGATVFSGGLGVGIQMLATVVLARLLTPKDFGLVAMVSTFSLLFTNFGLNGITEAVVQRETLDHKLASSLFWINLGFGGLLTIALALAAPLLGRFYGEPLVVPVTFGLSATIIFTSVSVLHLALLKRAMLFSAIAKNDLIAKSISVGVSIIFGIAGWGYWALVIGACALPLSTSVGAWIICRWLPGRPRFAEGVRPMVSFAAHTYGRFSLNYFTRNTDNLLVGWRFGAHTLGFYKKAYDLFAFSFTQIVSSTTLIAVSALSKFQSDREQFCRHLISAIGVAAFLGMGLSGVLALGGRDLILLLLGPQWAPAGYIFTFFAPGIGALFIYGSHAWIHLSIGRADRWLLWSGIEFAVTFVLFLLGLHWGAIGIAVAWCLSFWILTLPAIWFAGKPIDLQLGPVVAAVWRYIASSLVAGTFVGLGSSRMPILNSIPGAYGAALRVAFLSTGFCCVYLVFVALFHGGTAPLRAMIDLLWEMHPSRKGAKASAFSQSGATIED